MAQQLLDIVVTIGFVDFTDDEGPYTCSRVLRMDYEGTPADAVEAFHSMEHVVHSEDLEAKE